MRALKLFALGYLVKVLLVAIAWLLVPDLPARAAALARAGWARIGSAWTHEAPAAIAPATATTK